MTNSDSSVNFSALQTYDFMEPLSTDDGEVRSLLSSNLIQATRDNLKARGWQQTDADPDVLIDFLYMTTEQVESRGSSVSVGIFGGGSSGSVGGSVSTPSVQQTTRGTLSINFVDPDRNQVIWEGKATDRVTDEIRSNQNAATRAFIDAILADFP